MRRLGGGHFAQLTGKLYLAEASIDSLVLARLSLNEAVLRSAGGFGGWDTYPAAAQLGILDMAWNMGPAFGFPDSEPRPRSIGRARTGARSTGRRRATPATIGCFASPPQGRPRCVAVGASDDQYALDGPHVVLDATATARWLAGDRADIEASRRPGPTTRGTCASSWPPTWSTCSRKSCPNHLDEARALCLVRRRRRGQRKTLEIPKG